MVIIFCFLNGAWAAENGQDTVSSSQNHSIEYLKNTLPKENLESFRDEEENTSLHLALKAHDNQFTEEILENYPDLINIENLKQESPIYIADKYGNVDGVKLCLEYQPKKGSATNNCYQIFGKVKGTEPYHLRKSITEFYQPEEGENKDKLVIILSLPDPFYHDYTTSFPVPADNWIFQHFKENKVPVLIIGNKRHSIHYQLIKDSIEKIKLPEKITIIVESHGHMNLDGDHEIDFDNTNYRPLTKDLFAILKSIFRDKSIAILMTACHGGGAIKDIDLLPKGSSLLTLASADRLVATDERISIFTRDVRISKTGRIIPVCKLENYQGYPERFSLQHFLMLYLFSLGESNNIPTIAVSGAEKKFDYARLNKYIGHKLDIAQKNATISKLKGYCADNADCENHLHTVINKVEEAKNIDKLKAPASLYKPFYENLFSKMLSIDTSELLCFANDDLSLAREGFIKEYLGSSLITDFNVCNEEKEKLTDDIIKVCEVNKPTKPIFGVAMAVLYTIEEFDKNHGLKHDEL